MAFFSSMNIPGSGITAQRLRLDIISENIANQNTTRTEAGGTYRRKTVALEAIPSNSFSSMLGSARSKLRTNSAAGGVRVAEIIEDESDFKASYDPDHPDADEDGYVYLPNVDMLTETSDGMEAQRAYNANINAFNILVATAQSALNIGK